MAYNRYHKDRIGNHKLKPETLMLGYGYDPTLSEGAVKPPVFLTSTFVFNSAEHGKEFFDYVAGRREPPKGEAAGLVYSRFNHPNSEIVEDRLAIFEEAEAGLLFSSGMSAIATTILAFARPGDVILHSQPLYGGTETLIAKTLANMSIGAVGFGDGVDEAGIRAAAKEAHGQGPRLGDHDRDALQPAQHPGGHRPHPHASRTRSARPRATARSSSATTPCSARSSRSRSSDGADISVYSLTKYVGGHSDLIAGAALGSKELMKTVRLLRSAIGTQLDPHSCWMLGRSLETLALRMNAANRNGEIVAAFLHEHPSVAKVHHLAYLPEGSAGAGRSTKPRCERPRLDLLLRREGRRGGGLPGAQRAPGVQAGGEPGRHRVADLAPGLHDPFRRAEGDPRPPRRHRRHDPRLHRHRAPGRSRGRSGAGAGDAGVSRKSRHPGAAQLNPGSHAENGAVSR